MSEVMNVLGDECRGDECRTISLNQHGKFQKRASTISIMLGPVVRRTVLCQQY